MPSAGIAEGWDVTSQPSAAGVAPGPSVPAGRHRSQPVAACLGRRPRRPITPAEDHEQFFDHRAKIQADVEAMLDKIQASLHLSPSLAPLFTIRWEIP